MHRPSNKEIIKKVHEALGAVQKGHRAFALQKHLVDDLDTLGLDDENEYWQLIEKCLLEIADVGSVVCYAGGRPPQRSYEPQIKGMELWAYAWDSKRLQKPMYLKFALKNSFYFHVDCHENRAEK